MQKAVVVRTMLDDLVGHSWSQEVDHASESQERPLYHLLNEGWRVVHTCPMTSELDNCCLVILEKEEEKLRRPADDVMLADAHHPASSLRLRPDEVAGASWDGETIPLRAFGVHR